MKNNSTIILGIYIHAEYYPPTLNAIEQLCAIYGKVIVVHRNFLISSWCYPQNCEIVPIGKLIDVKASMNKSVFIKLFYFVSYTLTLLKEIKRNKSTHVLLYDYIPMLSYYLIRPFVSNKIKFWYHNHDVAEANQNRKYSLGWCAVKAEKVMFKYLSFFTYPSKERLAHFNVKSFTGISLHLPNYPSIAVYDQYKSNYTKGETVKLIYQGTVSPGHGLEQIANFIGVKNKNINLHIAGRTPENFKQLLDENLNDSRLQLEGYVPYKELPKLTESCHIGIAINLPMGIIYQTGGAASNKIYEYAACGLPILYYDNEHYNEYLSQYEWAFATDLSEDSLEQCINKITENYDFLSNKAKQVFRETFNFEKVFTPMKNYLKNN